MKYLILAFALICLAHHSEAQAQTIKIKSGTTFNLPSYEFDFYTLTVQNRSKQQIDVSIFSEKVKTGGFGLNKLTKEDILLNGNQTISVANNSTHDVTVVISAKEALAPKPRLIQYVNLTLTNRTEKSIMLYIPGVMNPNLSPMSDSGVSLKVGQEIFYKVKGKKKVILTIDESLEGQKIEVSTIIKEYLKS